MLSTATSSISSTLSLHVPFTALSSLARTRSIAIADLGYNAPGYRNTDLHTPALDALAQNGLILEEYYVFSEVMFHLRQNQRNGLDTLTVSLALCHDDCLN